ncbi:hypothetical protein [Streptomyces sp. A244]|uniref:hypothetical protein n=1 Tax=Streptomyces sp. A244 TaxID=2137016 RepID=UPI0035BF8452
MAHAQRLWSFASVQEPGGVAPWGRRRPLLAGLVIPVLPHPVLVSGLAPITAPLIGGQILRPTDQRGVFVVLALNGSALTALVSLKLPETLPVHERHGGGVGEALRGMRTLLADRVFTDVDDRGAGAP